MSIPLSDTYTLGDKLIIHYPEAFGFDGAELINPEFVVSSNQFERTRRSYSIYQIVLRHLATGRHFAREYATSELCGFEWDPGDGPRPSGDLEWTEVVPVAKTTTHWKPGKASEATEPNLPEMGRVRVYENQLDSTEGLGLYDGGKHAAAIQTHGDRIFLSAEQVLQLVRDLTTWLGEWSADRAEDEAEYGGQPAPNAWVSAPMPPAGKLTTEMTLRLPMPIGPQVEAIHFEGARYLRVASPGHVIYVDHSIPQDQLDLLAETIASLKPSDSFLTVVAPDVAPLEAVARLTRERERQVTGEGWTHEHDDRHVAGELSLAAACYAAPQSARYLPTGELIHWPEDWDGKWWKPTPDDRLRELSKAGALILAEMERLIRARDAAALEDDDGRVD